MTMDGTIRRSLLTFLSLGLVLWAVGGGGCQPDAQTRRDPAPEVTSPSTVEPPVATAADAAALDEEADPPHPATFDPAEAQRAAWRTELPLPPGVPASRLKPADDPDAAARARWSLAQVVESLPRSDLVFRDEVDRTEGQVVETEDQTRHTPNPEAIKQYAVGRSEYAQGSRAAAIPFLKKAIELDPFAAQAHALLGRVYFEMRRPTDARTHLAISAQLDVADVHSLLLLGRIALEQQETNEAIAALALGHDRTTAQTDAGLAYLIRYYLGQSLLRGGYDAAAVEQLTRFAVIRRRLDTSTHFRLAVAMLAQRKGASLIQAGDAAVRLGRFSAALDLYEQAGEDTTVRDDAVLPRVVYTALVVGEQGKALEWVIDQAEWTDVDDAPRQIVHYLHENAADAQAVVEAFQTAYQEQRKPVAMALALAGMLPEEQAELLLSERLSDEPDQWLIYESLIRRQVDRDPAAARRSAVEAIGRDMFRAPRYALALIRTAGAERVLADTVVEEAATAPAAYLRGMALRVQGDDDQAVAAFNAALDQNADFHPAAEAIVSLKLGQGKFDEALQLIDGLGAMPRRSRFPYMRVQALAGDGKTDEALRDLGRLLQAQPENTEYLTLQANLQRQRRDFAGAEASLVRILQIDPTNEPAYAMLFNIYENDKPDAQKFVILLRRINTMMPRSRIARLKNATFHIARKQYDLAETTLRDLLVERPTDPLAMRELIALLGRQERWTEAQDLLLQQIDDHPDFGPAILLLREVAQRNGAMELFFPRMERYLKQTEKTAVRAVQLASLYEQWDKPLLAVDSLREALELDPGRALQYHVQLASLYAQAKMADDAIAQIDSAIALEPQTVGLQAIKARLLFDLDRIDAAIKTLQAALDTIPGGAESIELTMELARLLVDAGRLEQGIAEVDRLIGAMPGQAADFHYYKSQLYSHAGQPQKAELMLQKALTVNADHGPANNDLGYMWADRGKNIVKAEMMIRRAVRSDATNAAYLDSLGWVLYKQGKFDEAAKWLRRSIQSPGGDDPVLFDHLGDALWQLGEKEEAQRQWREARRKLDQQAREEGDDLREDLKKLQPLLREKLEAARRDQPPPVAPIIEPAEEPDTNETETPTPADAGAGGL